MLSLCHMQDQTPTIAVANGNSSSIVAAGNGKNPPAHPLASVSEQVPTPGTGSAGAGSSLLLEVYPIGRMMWGKLLGYDWWPGYIVSHSQERPKRERGGEENGDQDPKIWLKWFGETQLSYVSSN